MNPDAQPEERTAEMVRDAEANAEIEAIRVCWCYLRNKTREQQKRILSWLDSRLKSEAGEVP